MHSTRVTLTIASTRFTEPSDKLLAACKEEDIDTIKAEVAALKKKTAVLDPVDLRNVWQVAYVDSLATLEALGTGKPQVAGRRVEDAFLVIRKRGLELRQVVRRTGPYPNEMQTLTGVWKVTGVRKMRISWLAFEQTGSNQALEGEKVFNATVAYVDTQVMVLEIEGGTIVLEEIEDMDAKLRDWRILDDPKNVLDEGFNPFQAIGNLFKAK